MRQCYWTYGLLIAISSGCATDRVWHEGQTKASYRPEVVQAFAPPATDQHYPLDSNLYVKMVDFGSSDYCAAVTSFSKSDITLERTLPNKCHKQAYRFETVRAHIDSDTVFVHLHTSNPRSRRSAKKMIVLKYYDGQSQTELIHWGSEYQSVTYNEGLTVTEKAPTSSIIKSKILLDKPYYQLGDTLVGEIKFASEQIRGRRGIKIKESTRGVFRTIIGGTDIDCSDKSYIAESRLR